MWLRGKYGVLSAVIALLVLFVFQVTSFSWASSATFDEPTYYTAAKIIIEARTFECYGCLFQPLFTYYWHHLPLYSFLDPYLSHNSLFLARLMILLLGVLLGLYVFLWSRDLFGVPAALAALFLYVFNPNILAHSGLITADFAVTCFMFVATYYFWKAVNRASLKNILFAGIFLGCAFLSKYSGLMLLGIYVIIGIFLALMQCPVDFPRRYSIKNLRMKSAAHFFSLFVAITIIALVIVNVPYLFSGVLKPLSAYELQSKTLVALSQVPLVRSMPVPLPEAYVRGLDFQGAQLGTTSPKEWEYRWYYAMGFLLKNPIPLLVLCVILLFFLRTILPKPANAPFLLVPIVLVFAYFTWFTAIRIGLRYILPLFPFVFVLVSNCVTVRFKRRWARNVFAVILGILFVGYGLSTALIYPHYLAYFNAFAGDIDDGTNPLTHTILLADGNRDWGQDLRGLKHWMDSQNITTITLNYFGKSDPMTYNVSYVYFGDSGFTSLKIPDGYVDSCAPMHGLFAISVTSMLGKLNRNPSCYHWLRNYTPIHSIGKSIYVYDIH